MNTENQNDQLHSGFDWIGLVVLISTLEGILLSLANETLGCITFPLFLVSLLILIRYFRRYNWKNVTLALFVFFTLHPVRILFHWWMNPVVYGFAAIISLILLLLHLNQNSWKNNVTPILISCILFFGWQTVVSDSEVKHCYVDDIRWNYYFVCKTSGNNYQQIEHLPIGMKGYCYYCPWY